MPNKIFSALAHAVASVTSSVEGATADVINELDEHTETSLVEQVRHVFQPAHAGLSEEINHITHEGAVEVTIYATYGYEQEGRWRIPLRGRVHQKRSLPDELVARLVARLIHYDQPDLSILKARAQAFTDDSRSGQTVVLRFDADPDNEPYEFPSSDFNGLIEREIELTDERARRLQAAQGAGEWLAFSVELDGQQTGRGRLRLIPAEGLSVVTDIDDTIKVTIVPGDKDALLRRTLCEEFTAAEGMAERYRNNWGTAAFHYVSGGPWQLYEPLYEFLLEGASAFPAGSFHLTYHPKNFLSEDTREILLETVVGSLGRTFAHKVSEISHLMERFPRRKFILVGDSGEVDPEVYRHIKGIFPAQTQEIWIRDVLHDAQVNPHRLAELNVIPVEPAVCATVHHYQKLALRLQEFYDRPYKRNTEPPCG